ncbi:MAG: energy transducer TonB [Bacteroidota bacterium]|nr:energy transducer TonB [Bacteroidota bacterium]MDP4260679.1 energy transducer TonB [Bacteroidota bacterium]
MQRCVLSLLLVILVASAKAQSWGDSSFKERPLFYSVEVAPKFPSGMQGYYAFLSENLKMPANKFSFSSHKVVIVRIILDTAGKIAFAEIEKGLNENYDQAALETVKAMPAWTPGLQNHHPVPVSISLPLLFID